MAEFFQVEVEVEVETGAEGKSGERGGGKGAIVLLLPSIFNFFFMFSNERLIFWSASSEKFMFSNIIFSGFF